MANLRAAQRHVTGNGAYAEAAIALLLVFGLLLLVRRWFQASSEEARARPEKPKGALRKSVSISEKVEVVLAVEHLPFTEEAEDHPEARVVAGKPTRWWQLLVAIWHSIALAGDVEVQLLVACINKRMQQLSSRGHHVEIQTLADAASRKRAMDRAEAKAQALAVAAKEAARVAEESERHARAAARREAGPVGKYVPPHLRNR
mmetsp:Transcript_40550/g.91017  ORF Transcript_40550/g.91017 Transcript_40550/m.91017 type:complete len:203 (-) Transcript_40550:47-655(-)